MDTTTTIYIKNSSRTFFIGWLNHDPT